MNPPSHSMPVPGDASPLSATQAASEVPPEHIHLRTPVPGYQVLGEVGRGGMGIVYKARHLRLGRVVALKMVLHGEYVQQQNLLRFLAEAEAVAQLQHPNIVQLFDCGEHEGIPFFTLELIEAGTLADRLRQNPLTPTDAARLLEQVALGVQHAHERGIVHRDLKPANVLLTADGTPKIADFGLAKRVDVGTGMTATGNVLGTPAYMAPEQASGKGGQVGPLADVYSLGAILYECLTGRAPFRTATAMDTLLQVMSDEPIPVRALAPKCPPDLATICHTCLRKEPGKRYASAQQLADDLRRFQNGEPIRARPVGMIERAVKWARRRPTAAALAVVALLVVLGSVIGGVVYNRQLRQTRARGLVAALRSADTSVVGPIVEELAEVRAGVEPELRALLDDPQSTQREKLHASLALLPGDAGQVEYLYGRLLTAEPHTVVVIRDALRPHAETLRERLWGVLENPKGDAGHRLRAACALAVYAGDDDRWAQVSRAVTVQMIAENPLVMGEWVKALKPAGPHLVWSFPPLILDEERGAAERRTLTQLYGEYAQGVPDAFVPLERVLSEQLVAGGAGEARVALARRQANAATALAAVGRWEKVTPLLRHGPDPTLRSYLIDRLAPVGADPKTVVERLEQEPDVSARRALLLALGEFRPDHLPLSRREELAPWLLQIYQDDPDPGIHGAAEWLLRQWQQQRKVEEIDRGSRGQSPQAGRRWYVNGQGQTMVVVPPGEFEAGEGEMRQKVKIDHRFALAARDVTVEQFLRFRKGHLYDWGHAPTQDCPVNNASWYDAVMYCIWLSKEEGIPEAEWCYEPNEKKEYAEGMKVKAHALALSGYRLPTEAEWEYACRAGSVTNWSMGDAEDLLPKYAWDANGMVTRHHPVGLLRPNDLGLFDMHGNGFKWCQDPQGEFPKRNDPKKEPGADEVKDKWGRPTRGGARFHIRLFARSADRLLASPKFGDSDVVFRPARTIR